jgi:hypothetical protein
VKIIEIIVLPSGQTRLETKGFAGTGCREASRFVEATLGQLIAEERTAEFYRTASELEEPARLRS